MCIYTPKRGSIGQTHGLLSSHCSHCLQIQSQVFAIVNMNSEPVNRYISDSLEVQSEISDESTLYIAVCLEQHFGNDVELCGDEPFGHIIQ